MSSYHDTKEYDNDYFFIFIQSQETDGGAIHWMSSDSPKVVSFNLAKNDLFAVNLSWNNEVLNCILLCYRFCIYGCITAKQILKFEEIFEIIRNAQQIEKL